eukprot:TRINITY_DN7553_c0_g1_i1.p1 TRINITY_DN7553_c0_g1~~TRINITY_DN7553_c0_g1_i1.p1  ORF type:complete len:535 (+),score=107.87 TRINITY_DN7553_c0_g1_i1:24-1628(+)
MCIRDSINAEYGVFSSRMSEQRRTLHLDGESLTLEEVYLWGRSGQIDLAEDAWKRIDVAREMVDEIVRSDKVVYGVNTGFGNFANVVIDNEKLAELQKNLILSHATGVGNPLRIDQARRLLLLRINVLAKGRSGIRRETVQTLIEAFNKSCVSLIPEKGTVGASGDLAPLAHLALGLLGEGELWDPKEEKFLPARDVLLKYELKPLQLEAKEGLALINGTQFITALGAEALVRAEIVAKSADIITALSLEVLRGTTKAFSELIHKARPHKGQAKCAERLRALLNFESELRESHKNCGKVQDAYSLRCSPQVHGPAHDTIRFVKEILEVEINSATDNPMVFEETKEIISGGNFHGEYPAKFLDYLAIGVHELSSISVSRIERLVNQRLSGLPAFLVTDGGLNSGFMIAHCTAAALVSENKVLCHPSSVDSIPTSAGQEDHVSMGGWSSRKSLQVIDNVATVLAIELLCACQALDLLRPLQSTPPLEALHALVRKYVARYDKDRYMKVDIDMAKKLITDGELISVVKPLLSDPDLF